MKTIKVEIPISDTDIDDILTTALEGGINYWCSGVKFIGETKDFKGSAVDWVVSGKILELHVLGEEPGVLSRTKLFKGIEKAVRHSPSLLSEELGAMDADSADTVIQFAVFDELVYG